MIEPLAEVRLAEIRQHVATTTNWSLGNLAARDLLAEVDRLKTEREEYVLVPKWDYELMEGQRDRATRAEERIAELEARPIERDALQARLSAVLDICDREQRNAMRWGDPIPVPEWVAPVQRAALGDDVREGGVR